MLYLKEYLSHITSSYLKYTLYVLSLLLISVGFKENGNPELLHHKYQVQSVIWFEGDIEQKLDPVKRLPGVDHYSIEKMDSINQVLASHASLGDNKPSVESSYFLKLDLAAHLKEESRNLILKYLEKLIGSANIVSKLVKVKKDDPHLDDISSLGSNVLWQIIFLGILCLLLILSHKYTEQSRILRNRFARSNKLFWEFELATLLLIFLSTCLVAEKIFVNMLAAMAILTMIFILQDVLMLRREKSGY